MTGSALQSRFGASEDARRRGLVRLKRLSMPTNDAKKIRGEGP